MGNWTTLYTWKKSNGSNKSDAFQNLGLLCYYTINNHQKFKKKTQLIIFVLIKSDLEKGSKLQILSFKDKQHAIDTSDLSSLSQGFFHKGHFMIEGQCRNLGLHILIEIISINYYPGNDDLSETTS